MTIMSLAFTFSLTSLSTSPTGTKSDQLIWFCCHIAPALAEPMLEAIAVRTEAARLAFSPLFPSERQF